MLHNPDPLVDAMRIMFIFQPVAKNSRPGLIPNLTQCFLRGACWAAQCGKVCYSFFLSSTIGLLVTWKTNHHALQVQTSFRTFTNPFYRRDVAKKKGGTKPK